MSAAFLPALRSISFLTSMSLVAAAGPVAAQGQPATRERPPTRGYASVTATVALIDELPASGAQAFVLRRADKFPHDVILLRSRDATSGRLAAAIASLLVARQRHGDVAGVDATVFVGDSVAPIGWKDSETRRAARVLNNARASAPQNIDGVGPARAVQVSLGVVRVVDRVRSQ